MYLFCPWYLNMFRESCIQTKIWINLNKQDMTVLSSPSSTFHIYVTIYHHQLHMMCMSHKSFDKLEHVLHMINFWAEANYSQISCCYMAFNSCVWRQHFAILWSIWWSSLSIQSLIKSNVVRYISWQLWSRFHTLIFNTDC